jgi:hypothetical protein
VPLVNIELAQRFGENNDKNDEHLGKNAELANYFFFGEKRSLTKLNETGRDK